MDGIREVGVGKVLNDRLGRTFIFVSIHQSNRQVVFWNVLDPVSADVNAFLGHGEHSGPELGSPPE